MTQEALDNVCEQLVQSCTRQCRSWDLNTRPFSRKSNALTTAPPSHSYYYIYYKGLTPHVHKEINIHVISIPTVSLLWNVKLTGVITENSSNKWVALTRAGWCVVCVVDYPASSVRWVAFHGDIKWGGRVYNVLMWKLLNIVHTIIIRIGSYFIELSNM